MKKNYVLKELYVMKIHHQILNTSCSLKSVKVQGLGLHIPNLKSLFSLMVYRDMTDNRNLESTWGYLGS